MIAAGELPQRVSIKALTETSDGHDGHDESWSVVRARVAAKVAVLAGRELERARQIDPRSTLEVTLRYWQACRDELTARSQVIYHDGGTDRTLEPVEPPRETVLRDTLVVICREAA